MGFRFLGFGGGGQSGHKLSARKMQELKLAFSEYYLSLVLLQNYQNLNYTGMETKFCSRYRDNFFKELGLSRPLWIFIFLFWFIDTMDIFTMFKLLETGKKKENYVHFMTRVLGIAQHPLVIDW